MRNFDQVSQHPLWVGCTALVEGVAAIGIHLQIKVPGIAGLERAEFAVA